MDAVEIKALREALQMTQVELAAKVGVTERTVRRWEGGTTPPSGAARKTLAMLRLAIPASPSRSKS